MFHDQCFLLPAVVVSYTVEASNALLIRTHLSQFQFLGTAWRGVVRLKSNCCVRLILCRCPGTGCLCEHHFYLNSLLNMFHGFGKKWATMYIHLLKPHFVKFKVPQSET